MDDNPLELTDGLALWSPHESKLEVLLVSSELTPTEKLLAVRDRTALESVRPGAQLRLVYDLDYFATDLANASVAQSCQVIFAGFEGNRLTFTRKIGGTGGTASTPRRRRWPAASRTPRASTATRRARGRIRSSRTTSTGGT